MGQQPKTPYERALEAHGGAIVLSVQNLAIHGQSTRGGKPQPVTISASLDGKLRVDYGKPVVQTEVFTAGGNFSVNSGAKRWKAPHAGAYAQLDLLSIFGVLHLAAAPQQSALEPAVVAGRTSDRVKAVTGRSKLVYRREIKDEADVVFDRETGLIAAISRQQFADESLDLSFQLTTTFSDYRPEGGMALPHKIVRFVDGQAIEEITVESVEINPAFEREFFGK